MNKKESIGSIALVTIIGEVLWLPSGVMNGAGMGALIGNWIPLIVGAFTITCHMISRLAI